MSERRYRHPQVNLRLPESLKEKISEMAERNKRSANSEMVAAIEDWVRRDSVYNFKGEASLIVMHEDSPLSDPLEAVNVTKGELNRMIGEAAEEAAYMVIQKISDQYDIVPKDKKPT